MSNKNGTRTIQADSELVKKISLLAVKRDKTRKELIDMAIREFLDKQGDS